MPIQRLQARRLFRRFGALSAGLALIGSLTASLLVEGPALATVSNHGVPLSYVAMGDSYSSVGTLTSPASGAPWECSQDSDSYPYVVAARLGAHLTDVACAGATSANLTGSQYPGQSPQLDALDATTDIVTIGIGGNDDSANASSSNPAQGFLAKSIIECGSIDLLHLWTGTPCKDRYGAQLRQAIRAEGPILAADFRRVHRKAPNAAVFVVGYADVLPQHGSCFPTIPLSPGDLSFMNDVEKRLNAVIALEAATHSATFVDTFDASIGHDACQPESNRWIEPLIPGTDAAPVHPNAAGQHAIGTLVAQAVTHSLDAGDTDLPD